MTDTAILVDWDLYRTNPYTQDFINDRLGQARMVLLVSDPQRNDYEYEAHFGIPYVEWDAVVRNSAGLNNVAFKATALTVLQDSSTLVPVIGLDANNTVNSMYREGGVLITVEDL